DGVVLESHDHVRRPRPRAARRVGLDPGPPDDLQVAPGCTREDLHRDVVAERAVVLEYLRHAREEPAHRVVVELAGCARTCVEAPEVCERAPARGVLCGARTIVEL